MAENNDKQSVNFEELRSTTSAMTRALKQFIQGLEPVAEELKEAKSALEEQNLSVRRTKAALGMYSNTILGRVAVGLEEIAAVKKKTEVFKKELAVAQSALKIQQGLSDGYRKGIARVESEIKVREAVLSAMNRQLASMQAETEASFDRTTALEEQRSALSAEKDATQSRAKSITDSIQQLEEEVKANEEAGVQAKIESKRKIQRLKYLNDSYTSEISEINKALTVARTKNANGKKLSDVEKSRIAELEAMKASAQAYRAKNEAAIDAEIASRKEITEYGKSLQQQISDLKTEYETLTQHIPEIDSELGKNAEALAKESFARADLKDGMEKLVPLIDKEKSGIEKQNNLRKKYADGLDSSTKKEGEYASAVEDLTKKVETSEAEEFSKKMEVATKAMKDVAKVLNDLVAAIRKTQQQFGITAGQAARLKLDNLVTSFQSYAQSLLSLGKKAAVSAAEIEKAQADFQSEFGGVLTSEAAGDLARQAKEMGVGTGELAKARRVFMTQTMGDTGAAKAAQDKFIGEFTKKGLTSKDAMQAIAQNSELLARNGTRFATSFARAAAEAKKIGVDLSKVDQVGDNIIGDFEGFLEKQAELGAMGFGFDSNRLAQVAETGDTGALFNELRSQLASTGKDITKLRRSEQLALSGAFGISMEELQRMAAPTAGSGEETLSPEDLQKDSNDKLGRLVEIANVIGASLAGIATLVGLIATRMAVRSIGQNITSRLFSGGASTPSIASGAATSAAAGAGTTGAAGAAGGAGGGMLSGLGVGLKGLAEGVKAFANPQAAIGLALVTASMIGLGYALKLAAPAIEAIGVAIKSAFEGIGTILVSAGEAMKNMFAGLSELSVPQMLALAVTLPTLAASLGLFAGASLLAAPGLILFTNRMGKLAEYAPGVQLLAASISQLNTVITSFNSLDTRKLSAIRELAAPSVSSTVGNAVSSVSNFVGGFFRKSEENVPRTTAPTAPNATMAFAAGITSSTAPATQAAQTVSVDLSKLEAKLDAVVRAIGSMDVKLDGNKVGQVIVSNDQRAAQAGVFRAQRL
jgi:hypothetical protein